MGAWQRTLECARALASRLVLFQCPARFTPTRENTANLRTFFHRATRAPREREDLVFVWEPRGNWDRGQVREICEELTLVHAVDPFQQPPITPGLAYLRLHGKTGCRYRYTTSDLEELLRIARSYASCYVHFNNISMVEDAREFQRLASRARRDFPA